MEYFRATAVNGAVETVPGVVRRVSKDPIGQII